MSTDANFHNAETLTGREKPHIPSLVSAFQALHCSKLCSYYRWLPFRPWLFTVLEIQCPYLLTQNNTINAYKTKDKCIFGNDGSEFLRSR